MRERGIGNTLVAAKDIGPEKKTAAVVAIALCATEQIPDLTPGAGGNSLGSHQENVGDMAAGSEFFTNDTSGNNAYEALKALGGGGFSDKEIAKSVAEILNKFDEADRVLTLIKRIRKTEGRMRKNIR